MDLDFLVEIPQGKELPQGCWDTEENLMSSLWSRMEYYLTNVVEEKLPSTVMADILARDIPKWERKDRESPRVLAQKQSKEGEGRWGLGAVMLSSREQMKGIALEIMF